MDKQKLGRKPPQLIGAAASAAARLAAGEKTGIVLRGVQRFALCALLARAVVFQDYAPFGLAMAAAMMVHGAGISALGGVFCGTLMLHGATRGAVYAAAALLTLCVVNICGGLACVRKAWFAPTVATLCGAVCTFVFLPVGQALTAQQVLTYAVAQLITGGACVIYSLALAPPQQERDWRRLLVLLTLAATLLVSLSDLTLFGALSPARAVALLLALSAAYLGGPAFGAAAGVALGAVMDMAAGAQGALFTCGYGLCALIAGLFSQKKRGVFALFALLSGLCAGLLGVDSALFLPFVLELICACVAFAAMPTVFWNAVRQAVMPDEEQTKAMALSLRQTAGKCAGEAAQAFYELYLSVLSGITSARAAGDEHTRMVFDHAAERVCKNCVLCSQCWQRDYVTTLSALDDVTQPMLRRGRAELSDFPAHFSSRCVHLPELLESINSALFALRERQALRRQQDEQRTLLARQYAGVTGVLRQLGSTALQDDIARPMQQERVRRYAAAFGWIDRVSVFLDGGGHLVIELFGEGIDDILQQGSGFSAGLGALLGISLAAPERTEDALGARLTLRQRAPLRVVVGSGRRAKDGEEICGDSETHFLTDRGQALVLLSDGMGTGAAAARDSQAILRAMERFLRAGVSPDEALRATAPAFCLRSGGERFVTLDTLRIDLYSGCGECLKCGAAPSYVFSGGVWSRMDGKALPVGLADTSEQLADVLPLRLGHGDLFVMLSDGVSDGRQDEWVRQLLERSVSASPKEIAAQLVSEACRRGEKDDKTALVIRVERMQA